MSATSLRIDDLVPSTVDRLVAAEVNDDGTATLFRRVPDGSLETATRSFQPWLLVAERALAESIPGAARIVGLEPVGVFLFRVHLPDWPTYRQAAKFLRDETGCTATAPNAPYRLFGDPQQQLLTMVPARLFRGMDFAELRRLQLDIETLTAPGFDFPNAERADDEIIMVALSDSTGWELCLSGPELPESEILKQMVAAIRERDPDVIEGHNIFDFDLAYIETRCRRHRVPLALGRDGSKLEGRPSRFTAGERTSSYRRYTAFGRHIVDTLHMVRLYDVIHRSLESHGLKAVARHFAVAAPNRTYVDPATISSLFHQDPAQLRAYAMDDVRETAQIGRILSPSSFYQAQLVPFSYQSCVTRGNAARIDAMLIAAYMQRDASIPKPLPGRPFQGALTASEEVGVFQNVWHADIQSLYPSIMVSQGIRPRQDSRNMFLSHLGELKRFRLQAKDAVRTAADRSERDHYDALQSSFKILINSFYGYLGFQQGTFNDFDQAEAVTREGRRILSGMVDLLQGTGATVLELDTDGIYFVPPDGVSEPADMQRTIQSTLPAGIEVDLDATYEAMFSYKSKNYALLTRDGDVAITGAALKSRGLEPFQRRYMHELVTLLLKGRGGEAYALHDRYVAAIEERQFPLADFAKREVLSTPPRVYKEKLEAGKTRRSAAYELVLASDRTYEQGDQVAFYVTGEKKNVAVADAAKLLGDAGPETRDQNVAYYLDKLEKLHAKFVAFLPPRPPEAPAEFKLR